MKKQTKKRVKKVKAWAVFSKYGCHAAYPDKFRAEQDVSDGNKNNPDCQCFYVASCEISYKP